MKSYVAILGAVTLVSAAPAEEKLVNGLRVVVSDTVITDRQVKVSAAPAIDVLRRQYSQRPEVFQSKAAETLENATQALVERQLIVQDFKASGYSFPDAILEDAFQERVKQQFGDRVTMIKTLQAEGRTTDQMRDQIREQIIIGFLQQKNVSSEIIISPHKIEAYYEQHRNDFKVEDQVKLRMIVLDGSASSTAEGRRKLADEIETQLKGGADFAQMAQVYSSGSQRSQGGDWGLIDRSVLRKELADVAFSLEPKKPSQVIETPDACYLMLVEEKRPAHIRPLSEVRDEIDKNLAIEERARLQKKYVEKLKNKTFIRYF